MRSIYIYLLVLTCWFSQTVIAQNTIGFRFTPNVIAVPYVENPSPGSVGGEKRLSFDAGIDFTHLFNKSWGVRAGIDIGVVDWNIKLTAPLNAFGIRTGNGLLNYSSNGENFMYNAVSAELTYLFNIRRSKIHTYLGPGLRYYHQEKESSLYGAAFNRSSRYDPDDPNAGPPDLLVDIAPVGDRFHLNVSTGIGIEKRFTRQTNLIFGIRKNWGLNPLGTGTLLVQMYDQLYYGVFNPRSNYIGVDLKLNYSLSKSSNYIPNPEKDPEETGKYRKSLFVEALGSGLLFSGNFEMRLRKDRNDGFGFRTGLGFGGFYNSSLENDLSTEKRYITFPIMVNHIIGMKRSGFETAVGFTPQVAFSKVMETQRAFIPHGTFNVGYRLQPIKDGLVVRATWTPIFDDEGFHPSWAGFSLGYSFR
jgi:hypothetical protein